MSDEEKEMHLAIAEEHAKELINIMFQIGAGGMSVVVIVQDETYRVDVCHKPTNLELHPIDGR